MGIIIFIALLIALVSFMKEGHSFLMSVGFIVIGIPLICLIPVIAIPLIFLILVFTSKGY